MTEKILLDTDIGSDIDDAVCLAYLLANPKVELLGITTVTGEGEKREQRHALAVVRDGQQSSQQKHESLRVAFPVRKGDSIPVPGGDERRWRAPGADSAAPRRCRVASSPRPTWRGGNAGPRGGDNVRPQRLRARRRV